MYIWFYVIDLWSQNQFLIDVARSLCEIVDVTFESRGLSGIRMSPTLQVCTLLEQLPFGLYHAPLWACSAPDKCTLHDAIM